MLIEVFYSFAVKFHVDRYKRRFKKISSTEGDELKYFGGELVKVGAGACFTTGNELKVFFRDELAMGRNLQFPTYKVLMALENVFKVLPSSLIQPCDNKYLISQEGFNLIEGFNLNFTQCCYTFG